MKKALLFMIVLLGLFEKVEAKKFVTSVIVDSVEMSAYENEFMRLNFELTWDGNFISVNIENKSEERLYIEWENTRLDDKKIVFNDDTRLSMKNEKPDEVVVAHSKTKKIITGRNHVLDSSISKITSKTKIKKNGYSSAVLILPIKHKEKTYDLVLNLKFTLE